MQTLHSSALPVQLSTFDLSLAAPTCLDCKHCHFIDETEESESYAECRRYPPKVQFELDDLGNDISFIGYDECIIDAPCGELTLKN